MKACNQGTVPHPVNSAIEGFPDVDSFSEVELTPSPTPITTYEQYTALSPGEKKAWMEVNPMTLQYMALDGTITVKTLVEVKGVREDEAMEG